MSETDEIQAAPSDAAEGGISKEDVRWLFDSLMRVPLWWLVAVSIAVVLSCLTVTRAAGGSYVVKFAVTTTAVALLGVMWLPAVIRVLAIVFRQGRVFGVEISGAGMEGFLARIARHKPTGVTLLPTQPQIEPDAEWPEADFEVPESGAEWEDEDKPDDRAIPAWAEARDRIYQNNRDIFLVHQIRPSKRPGQLYDVFVFLAGAHGAQPADIVDQADFFLGKYWGNKIFSVRNPGVGETIGMTTSAYGPTLCLCRVKFKEPSGEAILHRFLDFEMHWVFDAATQQVGH